MSSAFEIASKENSLPTAAFNRELTDSLKKELAEAFMHSVGRSMEGIEKVGIMFSGGIDSALIAYTAKRFKKKLFVYSLGVEGSEDIKYSRKFAEELGLHVNEILVGEEELVGYYRKVQSLLNESDLMKLELSIPFFICSLHANRDGVRVILTGSGAEELFAGYDRHLQCFLRGGDLRKMLSEELRALYSKDLKNAEFIASINHCELRYPFLDMGFIELATSLKPELNLSKEGEKKRILKAISKEIGLPEDVVERPKKAMQYGSGIHKILLKAGRKGLTGQQF